MTEQEILRVRKKMAFEWKKQTFDAFTAGVLKEQLAEPEQKA